MRVVERAQDLRPIGAARQLQQAVEEREPQRLVRVVVVFPAEEVDERLDGARPQRRGRHKVEERQVERRLLEEVVAIGALAVAGPFLDVDEHPLRLLQPRL